ncbi:HAD family hydrolase [Thermodesulforhabdus norvegica]|uniref:ATPase, P-type (Transporting), HAD superfamily, subfamily IC n=1 Tax=Thermodesulforhabdus norvegica TaxID=39841 RepID=A0A1I4U608_9BACT|nr:HAD family hydrolase [Thermodesulforhabdus norvegica]SFM84454.1 ATPase, P-type (transporting), HAD superfamily, subfamily IC [Thermodesulforhabdus norvegica]
MSLVLEIPGWKTLNLEHLVLDYNGTLAFGGSLKPEVPQLLERLSKIMTIHVLTADTFGSARAMLEGMGINFFILAGANASKQKAEYVESLGKDRCVCIGNGRNDRLMLKSAALGIAVVQEEGAAFEAIVSADVVTSSISTALELLLNPARLVATLRD